jgi:hypothetical protein
MSISAQTAVRIHWTTSMRQCVSVLGLASAGKTSLLLKIAPADGKAPKLQVQIPAIGCNLETIKLPRLTLISIIVCGAMPGSGLGWINDQAKANTDGGIFVMNAQIHEDELQEAVKPWQRTISACLTLAEAP